MAEPIDFWFSIGSTHAYLSAARLPAVRRRHGVEIRWRPFSVRKIMREMDNRFLAGKPEKYAYMWRDMKRRADMLGLDCNVPAPHPLAEFDLPNRVAVLAASESWCEAFAGAAFAYWFTAAQEPGKQPALSDLIRGAGQNPERVLALAESDEIGRDYDAATDEARALGIFGSPTFVVAGEVFWGDDRLEHALSWAKQGRLVASELAPEVP